MQLVVAPFALEDASVRPHVKPEPFLAPLNVFTVVAAPVFPRFKKTPQFFALTVLQVVHPVAFIHRTVLEYIKYLVGVFTESVSLIVAPLAFV